MPCRISLTMSYEEAERLLHSHRIGKTAFQHVKVPTLAALCQANCISVAGTGHRSNGSKVKSDYIKAIMQFVSYQKKLSHQNADLNPPRETKRAAA